MIKKTLLLSLLIISSYYASAQIKIGLKAGMNSINQELQDVSIIHNSMEEFKIAAKEASYGFHFGAMVNIEIGKFFLQPEVLFNSNRINYKLTNFMDPTMIDEVRTEKFQYLDIPVMFGFKIWKLKFNAGPVGHIFISNKSELADFDSYEEKFNALTWGYQAGIGIDITDNLSFDLRYEGNLKDYGSHVNFYGNEYEFDQSPTKIIGTVGYFF